MIRRPPRSTLSSSSAASDVYKRQIEDRQSGLLAGCVGIQRGLDYLSAGQVNLTYALYPQWRGRELATRAVRLAMEIGRRRGAVSEFVIRVATCLLYTSTSPRDR